MTAYEEIISGLLDGHDAFGVGLLRLAECRHDSALGQHLELCHLPHIATIAGVCIIAMPPITYLA